jgi:FkbM family methyltransferase
MRDCRYRAMADKSELMANNLIRCREKQIQRDRARWSKHTTEMIAAGDEKALKVYGCYRNSVLQGDFDQIDHFVDSKKISIDVGTNHGQFAMKLAAISKACLCIEPVKALSFVGVVLPENCLFRNVAAGRTKGIQVLRIPKREGIADYALSTMADDNPLHGYQCEEQTTEVWTVDELVRETFPEEQVGYIKIDVEGFEDQVLEGCIETLNRYKPNLQIELHGNDGIKSMCKYLERLDYRAVFFFKNKMFDASWFDPNVHRAAENEYSERIALGLPFDLSLFVADFYFIPLNK